MSVNISKLLSKASKSTKKSKPSKKASVEALFSEGSSKSKKKNKESSEPVFGVNKGYKSVQKNAQRLKRQQELGKSRLFRWFIKDGESANVRMVTAEPITFNEHTYFNEGGNSPVQNFTCTGDADTCKHCKKGNKSVFKGAYVIIDRRSYKIKNGVNAGNTVKNTIKLLVCGQTMLAQLEHQHNKHNLLTRDFEVTRTGSGKSTSYSWDRGEKSKLSKADKTAIAELCGEKDLDEIIIDNIKPVEDSEDAEEEDYDEGSVSKKLRKFGLK